MKHWTLAMLAFSLSLLNACASSPPNTSVIVNTDAALLVESNRFDTLKEGALKQLASGQPGTIPLQHMPALLKAINDARNEVAGKDSRLIPAFQDTFVLEASQVVELSEIATAKSSGLKGLIVFGAPTAVDRFDWVMAAVVNLETWQAMDVKFNSDFGKHDRTLKPDASTFTTMNDYMQMVGTASNGTKFASRFNLKRVFVPSNGEKPNFKRDFSAFKAYLPAASAEKRFVISENRAVYQVLTPSADNELKIASTSSMLQKVGDLR
jgi:hypothetical protein